MANFLKIEDKYGCELIIDVDKIVWMRKETYVNRIRIGDKEIEVPDKSYKKIKERIFHPFGTPHKT